MSIEQAFADIGGMILHHFGGGVYAKEMRIPAAHEVMQHKHSFDHLSILGSGRVVVSCDGEEKEYVGPVCITIRAGVHHKITALTDSVWFCVHATDCEDPSQVDEVLISKD